MCVYVCVCVCVYACTRACICTACTVCALCLGCIHVRWIGMRCVCSLCSRTTPDAPKQLSTMAMRLALASLCTALSEGEGQSVTRGEWSGQGGEGRGWRKGLRCLTCEVEGRTHGHTDMTKLLQVKMSGLAQQHTLEHTMDSLCQTLSSILPKESGCVVDKPSPSPPASPYLLTCGSVL